MAPGKHILDWMNSEEPDAKLFRVMKKEAKLARDSIDNKDTANQIYLWMF